MAVALAAMDTSLTSETTKTDSQTIHIDLESSCSTTDSSGPTDDEGGLGDDDVFVNTHVLNTHLRASSQAQEYFISPVPLNNPSRNAMSPVKAQPRSGSPDTDPGHVTLLEKIIRTHHIWYLPHIGRSAAAHLLRPMEPGVFIVRASSKAASMALSIRLPPGYPMDTDHYLIETPSNGAIRLEGSPHVFASLPYLLEYYCKHGEELQTTLTLPSLILNCDSRRDLRSFSLMGQDFWSSEQAQSSRSASRASGQQSDTSTLSKKRPSPSSGASRPNQSGGSSSSPPTKQASSERDIFSALRKSRSANEGFKDPPRYYGHSGTIGDANGTARRTFRLKDFLFGSNNGDATMKATNQQASGNSLAHCDYFSPTLTATVSSSQSAFSLSTNQNESPAAGGRIGDSFGSPNLQRRRLLTFKPSSPEGAAATSGDSFGLCGLQQRGHSGTMKPPLKPKPVLRREKSDLGTTTSAAAGGRLAQHSEGSPGPQALAITAANGAQTKQPLLPPKDRDQGLKTCVEELRKKRLECANLSTTVSNQRRFEQTLSKKDGSPHIVLRSRNDSIKPEYRLSVPNLNEMVNADNSVAHTVKALTAKMGRNPGTGELQTINEGLVTPVVRRKEFFANKMRQKEELKAKMDNHSFDDLSCVENAPKNGSLLGRRYSSERSPRLKSESPSSSSMTPPLLPWKPPQRHNSDSSGDGIGKLPQQRMFPSRSGTWSNVNTELKARQKIAKVRPTPHPSVPSLSRLPRSDLRSDRSSSSSTARRSEYAQLSDFAESLFPSRPAPDAPGTSRTDDDNVSVAGTVFNEPWDSNVWENLIDLAQYGDDKPTPPRKPRPDDLFKSSATQQHRSPATIAEEDDDHCYAEYGSVVRQPPIDEQSPLTITSKIWQDLSARIPSEASSSSPSTYDSRKDGTLKDEKKKKPDPKPRSSKMDENVNTTATENYSLGPVTSPPRLRHDKTNGNKDPGSKIQDYVEKLARDETTVFGATLRRFIECTVEAEECDPHVVIRNVRQFLNGIKNYLVKHGEGNLHELIERERSRLTATEFLNIDAILEAVLHKIVLAPVKPHLYHLMVREHSKNGSLQALSENLAHVRSLPPEKLGLKDDNKSLAPNSHTMEAIRSCLRKMQHHYSPLKKLESLLRAVALAVGGDSCNGNDTSSATNSTNKSVPPPADDLVRWLVLLLARSSTVGCEVEAWYMWELLPQQLLTTGDASYYLTALFSAVHVLKHPGCVEKLGQMTSNGDQSTATLLGFDQDPLRLPGSGSSPVHLGHTGHSTDAFIRVAIPDEQGGSIRYHTFPGVPQMTTGKLCRVIAHQFGITNPEDHGLYLLVDGFETCLLQGECPDVIRDQLRAARKPHMFAYKRHEAKIAWPKVAMSPAVHK